MTAKDLLHKTLDYWCRWSNVNDEPATIRLAQIYAMQKAFGLVKSESLFFTFKSYIGRSSDDHLLAFKYLLGGEFLRRRPHEENKVIEGRIHSKIQELYPDAPEGHINRPADISWLYNNLLLYRKDVYDLTCPDGGMLEGFSGGLYYSFYLKSKLKKVIIDNLEEIDETLWIMLDPLKRYIDKEVLIREYDYPDADLESIDREWRIANY